ADVVAQHLIAAGALIDQYAPVAVAGDDVACPGPGTADRVIVAVELDANVAVAQRTVAASRGADGIAPHDVADAGDVHAMVAISGDQVACPGGGAADRVAVAIPHSDAVVMVSYCGGAGGIGADVVAQHLVIVAAAGDVNAAGAIAGDEV